MLSLAVLSENSSACEGITKMTRETGMFDVVYRVSPKDLHIPGIIRALYTHDPDLVLLDVNDWMSVTALTSQIKQSRLRGILVGFRPGWNEIEQVMFQRAGVHYLLREPISSAEMETVAYEALHKERSITNPNILAFLPAKAGGGCSTVALHTAAALAHGLSKSALLIEGDRRSGVYSIMLNLSDRPGLDVALRFGHAMTPVDWYQHVVRLSGFDLLPASPQHRTGRPIWADYYQLLRYVQKRYDYLLIDLPEVVNEATAEVVRAARSIFVVCTPEIASLKMARLRAEELQACEIPCERIQVILNRQERNSPDARGLEEILERPIFGILPNDYGSLKAAMVESRLAAPESPFAEACGTLARKLGGLPEVVPERPKFALLRKLSRIAG
ncbi:MAG TPA: hypothetical protein VEV17_05930 [Bryobacteraceae bacterium]|nr:hypothetical protein [Bryobacteraceae bacterium]